MSETSTILVVDDTPENIDVLSGTLRPVYKVKAATNGTKALQIAQSDNPPDLILLDVMMPGMDGYETCKQLKSHPRSRHIPVIFITALSGIQDEARGLQLGAVDYISKPFIPNLVKSRVANQLELKKHRDRLEELVQARTEEILSLRDITIEAMGTLAEYRDPETGGHIKRTQNYIKLLAEALMADRRYASELDPESIELLFKSAPLHDIGKVAIRDHILLKPGKLTPDEMEEMKKHTDYGYESIQTLSNKLEDSSFLRFAQEIAISHHEKWDGSGYPRGLAGNNIPVSGRLMAIADVYDALISRRCYKDPFSHQYAVEFIRKGRGTHFDPVMVDKFLELTEQFRAIALRYADHEEEREMLQNLAN
ncbi:MAG: two-component system response regulator [Ketobacteraceae bacterium]|nr:two-component system response regulator [Ketobacteraceae bacterium]